MYVTDNMDSTYTISRQCPICRHTHEVTVKQTDFEAWQGGELVQRAFPYLTGNEREILISGICSVCWVHMFDEAEE